MVEEIKTRSGVNLLVERREIAGGVEISLRMKNRKKVYPALGTCAR